MRVLEVIHHGDYYNERIVNVENTFEGFLDLVTSGPYKAVGRAAEPSNPHLIEAWEKFAKVGRSEFGWCDYRDLDRGTKGLTKAQKAAYEQIIERGYLLETSGVQLRTVKALHYAGLIDLKVQRARRDTPEWEATLRGR